MLKKRVLPIRFETICALCTRWNEEICTKLKLITKMLALFIKKGYNIH